MFGITKAPPDFAGGSGLPVLPPGQAFLIDDVGDYLVDDDGDYLTADE